GTRPSTSSRHPAAPVAPVFNERNPMSNNKIPVSFEFFPTKTEAGHEKLIAAAHVLAEQQPEFFSVTYGAGGSTRDRTVNTVLQLDQQVKIPTAPHLSCVGDSK